jgi:hypothetical protein
MSGLDDLLPRDLRDSIKRVKGDTEKCLLPYKSEIKQLETELKAKREYEQKNPGWAAFRDSFDPFYTNARELSDQLTEARSEYNRAIPHCVMNSVKRAR